MVNGNSKKHKNLKVSSGLKRRACFRISLSRLYVMHIQLGSNKSNERLNNYNFFAAKRNRGERRRRRRRKTQSIQLMLYIFMNVGFRILVTGICNWRKPRLILLCFVPGKSNGVTRLDPCEDSDRDEWSWCGCCSCCFLFTLFEVVLLCQCLLIRVQWASVHQD